MRHAALLALLAAAVVAAAAVGASADQSSERFVPVRAGVVVPAGGRATVGIRVRRPAGAFERRTIRALRVPQGLRVRWSRETENGDLTLVITAASDLKPGRRRVFIAYKGGAAADIRVLTPAPRPTFALTLQPSVLEIPVGEEQTVDVRVQRIDGFTDPVELSAQAQGAVSAQLAPTTLRSGSAAATLRITAAGAGAGQVVVTARGRGQERTAVVAVRVVEPPLPAPISLALARNEVSVIPVSLSAGQAVTLRATIETGDVDLSAFDAAQRRLAVSAKGGTATEEISLAGPGEFTVEVRAVVDSRVQIAPVTP